MTRGQYCRLLMVCGCLAAVGVMEACQSTGAGAIDRSGFNASVRPGDNFFQYVNGGWIKSHPIPAEYSRWGAFGKLRDDNLTALKGILDGLGAAEAAGGDKAKLRDLYATAMDQKGLDEQGAKPLAAELERIGKIASKEDVVAELAHLRAMGASEVFGFSVGQDAKQSDRYAVHLHQGGLGLPEREYYVNTGEEMTRIRQEYHEHVAAMMKLLGDAPEVAGAEADAVMKIETMLARASRAAIQLRDEEANYNKKTMAELAELTPNFNWDVYLRAIDVTEVKDVIVGQPEFFGRLNTMLTEVTPAEWQAYLRWHLVHGMAPYLSSDFETENFHFYSEIMRGVKEMQPRWKRAIGTVDRTMGDALGRLYVEKYFSAQAEQRMDAMVKNLLAAYKERIATRDWMGPETRKQALIKLAAITPKIGYPDRWRDYSGLDIQRDSYAQNIMRAMAFESRYQLGKLGKPVDRMEWHMTPPTVNAYYNGSMNEIVFPAGILQPPFFDQTADDAVNYGAIGAVIGHEITHGFDDQGSRMDAQGNLKNWWTAEDRARFTAKTDMLIKQYDACVAVGDLHVSGGLTLGENLADLGGVTIAYAAYQKSLGGKEAPVIGGFTGPQRFFIGYAQVWRDSVRDADQRVLLRTDPHSPAQFRTLVPLSNVQGFYDAFGVKPGDAMYRPPEERVEVW